MSHPSVYPYSKEEAILKNELTNWRESNDRNIACSEFLKTEFDKRYDGKCVPKDLLTDTINAFGFERTKYVLAATILAKDFDGRIRSENHKWAATIHVPDPYDITRHFLFDNAGAADILANQYRKLEDQANDLRNTIQVEYDRYTDKLSCLDLSQIMKKSVEIACFQEAYEYLLSQIEHSSDLIEDIAILSEPITEIAGMIKQDIDSQQPDDRYSRNLGDAIDIENYRLSMNNIQEQTM